MNHFISLAQAIQMTTAFRENRDTILADPYKGANYLPNAETFDRAAFDAVLAQPACEQLRIYYGMDTEMKLHAIVVGVDAGGQDILPEPTSSENTGKEIIEVGQRCPPECTMSLLNP